MSLDIDQIALHQLVKRDEQTLDVVLRDSLLHANRKDDKDFLAFSRATTGRLRDELAKYTFAEGGVVLFVQYLSIWR